MTYRLISLITDSVEAFLRKNLADSIVDRSVNVRGIEGENNIFISHIHN